MSALEKSELNKDAVPLTGWAKSPDRPKSIWNSLEIAKLCASVATPIMILVMGSFLSWQTANDNRVLQRRLSEEAALRERVAVSEANKRSEDLRRENEDRDDKLRNDARKRDDDLRLAAEQRDDALRSAAILQESRSRQQALEASRIAAVVEKRYEIWGRLAPKLTSLNRDLIAARRSKSRQSDLEEYDKNIRDLREEFAPDLIYFSPQFSEALKLYFFHTLVASDRGEGGKFGHLSVSYDILLKAAVEDLGLSPETIRNPTLITSTIEKKVEKPY